MGKYDPVRKHMIIYGDVQGVGFRYRARYAASGLGVTGWVKNCWDGTVEMEVQGTMDQINRMLVTINRGSYISIDRIRTTDIPVEEDESGFDVKY